MKKAVLALVVSLAIASVSILAAVNASAWGAESGSFPDRIFEVGKTSGVSSDWALYITSIEPTTDCDWWVELIFLGGSEVEVIVQELHENAQKTVSRSELTEVGQLSEKVFLRGNFIYYVTFKYIGKPGASILAERTDMSAPAPIEHAPISIASDEEFTAENGVVAGSGLLEDPYIISGWYIESADSYCISITDTRAYFTVDGVTLRAASTDFQAMYLGNVYNGRVVDSYFLGGLGGLMVEACSGISVIDCDFVEGIYGVQTSSSSAFELRGCFFTDCAQAFGASWSSGFTVVDCVLEADIPCWLDNCGEGVFIDNYMESLDIMRMGAYVLSSDDMTFSKNRFVNCGIDIVGWFQSNFVTHVISPDNTVNGKPILQYQQQSGLVLDGVDAGEIIIVECQDVTVSNMAFSSTFAGVIAAYSSQVTIEDNTFTSCGIGARVYGCSQVTLRGNVIEDVREKAIGVWSTVGATIEGNTMSSVIDVYQTLMPIYHSSDLRIIDNTLTDSWQGMNVFSTSSIEITGNRVSGMMMEGVRVGYSSDISVTGNVFEANGVGLSLRMCSQASVYHNDFLGNTVQAIDTDGVEDRWDDGYPSGGNYWSDYTGTDADGDGIGDTPYTFEVDAQDSYPLMSPFGY